MAWFYLALAGIFEIAFTTAMRYIDGFQKPLAIASFVAFSLTSFAFLALAIRTIPMGTAYAVWTGIGAAGTALVGMVWYEEPAETLRIMFLGLLIVSIVGLKMVSHA